MRARRLPLLDEYAEGDEAVVFVAGNVVALSALATAALRELGPTWTDAGDVAAALVEAFGEPPPGIESAAMTRSALESLAELGIVELR